MIATYTIMCRILIDITEEKDPTFVLDVIVTNGKSIVPTHYVVIQVLTATAAENGMVEN